MIGFGVLAIHYYFKYNGNVSITLEISIIKFLPSHLLTILFFFQDWSKKGGWRVMKTKPTVLPGQPGFPFKSERTTAADYADRSFKNAPI